MFSIKQNYLLVFPTLAIFIISLPWSLGLEFRPFFPLPSTRKSFIQPCLITKHIQAHYISIEYIQAERTFFIVNTKAARTRTLTNFEIVTRSHNVKVTVEIRYIKVFVMVEKGNEKRLTKMSNPLKHLSWKFQSESLIRELTLYLRLP